MHEINTLDWSQSKIFLVYSYTLCYLTWSEV